MQRQWHSIAPGQAEGMQDRERALQRCRVCAAPAQTMQLHAAQCSTQNGCAAYGQLELLGCTVHLPIASLLAAAGTSSSTTHPQTAASSQHQSNSFAASSCGQNPSASSASAHCCLRDSPLRCRWQPVVHVHKHCIRQHAPHFFLIIITITSC